MCVEGKKKERAGWACVVDETRLRIESEARLARRVPESDGAIGSGWKGGQNRLSVADLLCRALPTGLGCMHASRLCEDLGIWNL